MKRSTWWMVVAALAVLVASSVVPAVWPAFRDSADFLLGAAANRPVELTDQDLAALVAAHLAMLLLTGRQRVRREPRSQPAPGPDVAREARRQRTSRDALRLMQVSGGRAPRRNLFPVRQTSPSRPAASDAWRMQSSAGPAAS